MLKILQDENKAWVVLVVTILLLCGGVYAYGLKDPTNVDATCVKVFKELKGQQVIIEDCRNLGGKVEIYKTGVMLR